MWLIPQSLASALASECSMKGYVPDSGISADKAAFWAMSSGTPTLRQSSWQGWKARRWSRHLFGPATFRTCDGSNLLAGWTSSARASRASRTAWPEVAKESMTTAGYGLQSQSAFAWFDRDSFSWKTSPDFDLLGEWLPYSQTWPRSGSVLNGTASERQTWGPLTKGNECSSSGLMTPPLPNGGRCVSAEVVASKGQTEKGKRTVGLESQVRHAWATPDCNTSTRSNGLMGPNIREQASAWPTPASRDQKGENSMAHMLRTDGRTDGRTYPSYRPTAELCDVPLFAPGPNDERWAEIISARPDLAPATQPAVRGFSDGLASGLDEYRSDRLRCGGNGVVPLQAGLAFVVLARRAGIYSETE